MSDSRRDFLEGYVEVKDRIKTFYELYGQGRLVTDHVEILTGADGKQRVMVRALAYRSPDDALPAVGYSWMEIPGTTNYTRGSELENTETSAIGRAIGFLGILVDPSIASANEVRAKADDDEPQWSERDLRAEARTNGVLIGVAEKGTAKTTDYYVRQSPKGPEGQDGPFLGFRLKDGHSRSGQIVEAWGDLAVGLALVEAEVVGQRVQVWGHLQKRDLSNGGSYQAFVIERIQTPTFVLPDVAAHPDRGGATSDEPDLDNPPALTPEQDAELAAIPLFDDEPKAPAA